MLWRSDGFQDGPQLAQRETQKSQIAIHQIAVVFQDYSVVPLIAGKVPLPEISPPENCPPEKSPPRKTFPSKNSPLEISHPRKMSPGKFPIIKGPPPRKSLEMYQKPSIHLLGLTFFFTVVSFFCSYVVSVCSSLRSR